LKASFLYGEVNRGLKNGRCGMKRHYKWKQRKEKKNQGDPWGKIKKKNSKIEC
jgi:hypothetical protein